MLQLQLERIVSVERPYPESTSKSVSPLSLKMNRVFRSVNVARVAQLSRFSTRFSKSHEYIKLDGDIGTIGITDHAASALGDIVFVDLPSVGTKFSAGDSFGSVESVKAASDVYSPVAGEVVEVNSELGSAPGTVNESPMGTGWFIKLKVSGDGKGDFDKLLDETDYKKTIEDH